MEIAKTKVSFRSDLRKLAVQGPWDRRIVPVIMILHMLFDHPALYPTTGANDERAEPD
jgi:hypothetical protein